MSDTKEETKEEKQETREKIQFSSSTNKIAVSKMCPEQQKQVVISERS